MTDDAEPANPHAGQADADDQSPVRDALNHIKKEVIASGKSDTGKEFLGIELPFTRKRLRDFLAGGHISSTNYELLKTRYIHSLLGRVLIDSKSVDIKKKKDHNIFDRLANGGKYVPGNVELEGHYFLYYGSYVEEDRFAIRAIEIKLIDNSYEIIDSINDRIQAAGGCRESHGYMTLFRGNAQFLLLPEEHNETKVGFTFMLEKHPSQVDRKNRLQRMTGIFVTLTTTGGFAICRWLMQRETLLDIEDMKTVSGAYKLHELASPDMERHVKQFQYLSEHQVVVAPDPMLNWSIPKPDNKSV